MSETHFTDPTVSRRKFEREIAEFREMSEQYTKRGWFLAYARYPHVRVVLATPTTNPVAIMLGVALDFTNYDSMPPSVKLVHPLTGEPYKASELPTKLPRLISSTTPEGLPPQVQLQVHEHQDLMQSYGPQDIPFLCVAGVREYHEHPAHTGDAWELHRASGAGRLARLVELISKYGPDTVIGLQVTMQPQIGFNVSPQQ